MGYDKRLIWLLILFIAACDDDDGMPAGDLTHIPYSPVEYSIQRPAGFPEMEIPADNLTSQEGVQLGRMLFYDPILSIDSTISCSSCHLPSLSFTDAAAMSSGVGGLVGKRSSMSLVNIGYHYDGLFWDGRAADLEEQALEPVTNPVEMANDWALVEERLRDHRDYPERFRRAFGISSVAEIDRTYVTKAIAQFERIMISSGNSRYDRFLRGEIFPTDDELNGYEMFFDTTLDLPDAECGHCHTGPLLTTNEYLNNGVQQAAGLDDYEDKGRGLVTNRRTDNGKFKVPTLRNIELTAPYMHDGRFETLDEVLDHYNSGGHHLPPDEDNVSNFIRPLGLTQSQKQQIIDFLHMLTDTSFVQNPDLSDPFK